MVEVLVWILAINVYQGGLDTRHTFRTQAQCEYVARNIPGYANVKCIQANIYIQGGKP